MSNLMFTACLICVTASIQTEGEYKFGYMLLAALAGFASVVAAAAGV